MKPISIYADGACSGNQNSSNIGGWGAVLEYDGRQKELFGGEADTTNNRMEMTALLAALRAIKKEKQLVRVFSDSAYLMDCFRKEWHLKWRQNGWITSNRSPVENRDLWEQLLSFLDAHSFRFYRVKGHVSLKKGEAALQPVYAKFLAWNGTGFSFEDFLYITEMNIRADALANCGIDQIRNA
ncbi:MAG: ribonuclease HI [Clostridiales Family XIII bacterium]|jgi:ribonuclease HI|nr:ribonuclease HI [Clostridiales Family XIII bacterium]